MEASIADVKDMIRDRVGVDGPWEVEWVEEVQKLLEMDAGWGWRGFWETVRANVHVSPAPKRPHRKAVSLFFRVDADGSARLRIRHNPHQSICATHG